MSDYPDWKIQESNERLSQIDWSRDDSDNPNDLEDVFSLQRIDEYEEGEDYRNYFDDIND